MLKVALKNGHSLNLPDNVEVKVVGDINPKDPTMHITIDIPDVIGLVAIKPEDEQVLGKK